MPQRPAAVPEHLSEQTENSPETSSRNAPGPSAPGSAPASAAAAEAASVPDSEGTSERTSGQVQPPCWPLWLEDTRLDDALTAAAYEQTPPEFRAALKTGLALACMHYGQPQGRTLRQRADHHLGFWEQRSSQPVPWALLLFTPAYAAAARFTAACAAMQLADVPLTAAVCVDGTPRSEVLVSLELSGVEDIFCLDAAALAQLLRDCPAGGRLVLLHRGELEPVAREARALGLPCHEEAAEPCLRLSSPEAFDLDILAFAQGEALSAALPRQKACPQAGSASHSEPPSSPADAIYLAPELLPSAGLPGTAGAAGATAGASLLLTPGCEGFWLHQGLTPAFFTHSVHIFGPL